MCRRRFEESLAWLGGGLKPRVASQTILGRLVCGSESSGRRLESSLDKSRRTFGAVREPLGYSFLGFGRDVGVMDKFHQVSVFWSIGFGGYLQRTRRKLTL